MTILTELATKKKLHKEVNLYSSDLTETLLKQRAFQTLPFANALAVPSCYLSCLKDVLPNHVRLATFIDTPSGYSDTKIRQHATIDALKKGASIIDLVVPHNFLRANSLEPLYRDISTQILICQEKNATLRLVFEYRQFDLELLKKVANTAHKMGVDYCLPASGFFVDEITDNILAGLSLCENNTLNVITNGNIYTAKHIETIQKTELFGLRINWNSPKLVYNTLETMDSH